MGWELLGAKNYSYKRFIKTRIFKVKEVNDYVEDSYARRGFFEGIT